MTLYYSDDFYYKCPQGLLYTLTTTITHFFHDITGVN